VAGAERRVRVLSMLTGHGPDVDQLCSTFLAGQPDLRGVSLVVMSTLPSRGTRYTSDELSGRVEQLQSALGEGPGRAAFAAGQPVLVPDLADRQAALTWPAFAPEAVAVGVRAVFALPLRIGRIRLGVLDMYRDHPGDLRPEALDEALVCADALAILLALDHHADATQWQTQADQDDQESVQVATGMIMVQTGSDAPAALARLRAHAFATGRDPVDLAQDVVTARLTFRDLPD
jgi:ANTAR domain/GAF domain